MVESKHVLHNGLKHWTYDKASFSSNGTREIRMLFSPSNLGYYQWIKRIKYDSHIHIPYIQRTNKIEASIEHK